MILNFVINFVIHFCNAASVLIKISRPEEREDTWSKLIKLQLDKTLTAFQFQTNLNFSL